MDDNKKRAELANWLVKSKGLVNPAEQDAEVTKLAAQCPDATAKEKGLTTDVAKAYEVMQITLGQNTSPTQVQTPTPTAPMSAVTAQEELSISKTLATQRDQRAAVSQNTAIDKLLLDRPAPADIIPAGTKGMINKTSWENIQKKISSGEYTVRPDDGEDIDKEKRVASTTNYNQLKAAFESNSPVDVYIGKLSTRPIGYMVRVGSITGTSDAPKQMTRAALERYLILETAGYILSAENKPGAKLKYIKEKVDSKNIGKTKPGRTILADANKKNAVAAGSFDITRQKSANTAVTSCKSDLQFKVTVKDKYMKDGVTPLVRTIRVSLTATLPVLERKEQYIDTFGTGERESNDDLSQVPTGDMAAKINNAQMKAIALLRQKQNDPTAVSEIADIADKLAAFDSAAGAQPANVAM